MKLPFAVSEFVLGAVGAATFWTVVYTLALLSWKKFSDNLTWIDAAKYLFSGARSTTTRRFSEVRPNTATGARIAGIPRTSISFLGRPSYSQPYSSLRRRRKPDVFSGSRYHRELQRDTSDTAATAYKQASQSSTDRRSPQQPVDIPVTYAGQ